MMGKTKVCTKCGESRPLDDFQRKLKGSEARRARCRMCRRQELGRRPTGRSRGYTGLEGNSPEEIAEIRRNYLVEHDRKERERDAMLARLDRDETLKSDDWVRNLLGLDRVEVTRSRVLDSLSLPSLEFEEFDFIDDHLELMGGMITDDRYGVSQLG